MTRNRHDDCLANEHHTVQQGSWEWGIGHFLANRWRWLRNDSARTMCLAKGSDVRPGVPWVSASFALRGTLCMAKGSDVRPYVPWVSASFAWQAWDNVHCQAVGCTPWRPFCQGVGCTPWRPLGLRLFCVAGVGQCALPRGRMYAASFAWQAWDNVYCQGVGCMPWRPLGLRLFCVADLGQCALPRGQMYALASLGSPPLLRGRRGTMCIAKGSDARPGVPWVSASFAWQAWDNVHCQGVGCTPWRPLGLRLFCVAGVGQCALPRGRMHALASLGSPPLLRGRRGTMCIAKGSDVRPGVPWVSASFAWQTWDNVHCQGVGCTPLASLGSPPLLRGRRGTMCIAKGSDVRPGVPWLSASFAWQAWDNVHCQGVGCTPWRPLGLRLFCVADLGQCALPRGRMYALASLGSPPLLRGRRGTMCIAKGSDVRPGVPWVSVSFAWQAWDNVHCQGVGCTPWRPLGLRLFCVAGVGQCALPRGRMYALASLESPPLLSGRRGTMCLAKGSDVRGRIYALASLGLRLFSVADVGQCALPRGRMYGVGYTPWRPLGSASLVWQAWDNALLCGTHSLTHSPTHSLTHPPVHAHTHTHPPTHPHTHTLWGNGQ